jgi:hypothetical protein
MKQFVVASALMVGLTIPAFAAEKYFVTVDTVGNCSVLEGPRARVKPLSVKPAATIPRMPPRLR